MSKSYYGQTAKFSALGSENRKGVTPYENLANAIILKAVRDYQHALTTLHFNPSNKEAIHTMKECESFFHSEYFSSLTTVDGDRLMKLAAKQMEERNWVRFDVDY